MFGAIIVQAGLAINDNYGMLLTHHQKLSSDGQKSSQHIRLDMLNRLIKQIAVVGRGQPWSELKSLFTEGALEEARRQA